jgi:hypothetical protein
MDENQTGYVALVDQEQPKAKAVGFDIGLSNDTDVTYDIPFGFDADGSVIAAISVVSKNSQSYKDADRSIARTQLKKSGLRGRPLDFKKDADADEFIDSREASDVTLAVAVTAGWFGLTDAGEEFPFSAANAKALYSKNATVRSKVLAAAEEQANFLKR